MKLIYFQRLDALRLIEENFGGKTLWRVPVDPKYAWIVYFGVIITRVMLVLLFAKSSKQTHNLGMRVRR